MKRRGGRQRDQLVRSSGNGRRSVGRLARDETQKLRRDAVLIRQAITQQTNLSEAHHAIERVVPRAARLVPNRNRDVHRLEDIECRADSRAVRNTGLSLHPIVKMDPMEDMVQVVRAEILVIVLLLVIKVVMVVMAEMVQMVEQVVMEVVFVLFKLT